MLIPLLALLATSSGPLLAAAQQVNTPGSLTTCQDAQLVIEGGTAPYFVQILPGGQTSAKPLETLPTVYKSGPLTWLVDLPAGTNLTLGVTDSAGAVSYSSPITVQQGTSTDCVGKNADVPVLGASSSGASSSSAPSSSVTAAASPSSSSSDADASTSSAPISTQLETNEVLPSATSSSSSTTVVVVGTPTQSKSSGGVGKNEERRLATLAVGAALALAIAFSA